MTTPPPLFAHDGHEDLQAYLDSISPTAAMAEVCRAFIYRSRAAIGELQRQRAASWGSAEVTRRVDQFLRATKAARDLLTHPNIDDARPVLTFARAMVEAGYDAALVEAVTVPLLKRRRGGEAVSIELSRQSLGAGSN